MIIYFNKTLLQTIGLKLRDWYQINIELKLQIILCFLSSFWVNWTPDFILWKKITFWWFKYRPCTFFTYFRTILLLFVLTLEFQSLNGHSCYISTDWLHQSIWLNLSKILQNRLDFPTDWNVQISSQNVSK